MTILALFTAFLAATGVSGVVRDARTHTPLAGVRVEALSTHDTTTTDAAGRFALPVSPPVRLRFSRGGYTTTDRDAVADSGLVVQLVPTVQSLERVTISAVRGGNAAPISADVVTRDQIAAESFGQEPPLLLANTPSFTSYAEQGGYSGYSYIRLRGIDQTRINLTLDGIPLNDPEDEVFYFADLFDFMSSVQSVQIQRGVGTSTNGTASYGGSINFESLSLTGTPAGGHVQLGAGDWNTGRASVDYASGLLANRWAFYARASDQSTNSYREHAGDLSHSGFFSAGYFGDRNIVKITATAGLEHSQLAYDAAAESTLVRDRRSNPLSPDERDDFGESLASVVYTHLLSDRSSLSTTVYGVTATGYYDVLSTQMDRYHLDFWWGGVMSTYRYTGDRLQVDAGVYAADYHRDHYDYTLPDLTNRVYSNRGIKREASGYVKTTYALGPVALFGDVQLRDAWWRYVPDRNAGITAQSISWRFFNPKAGLTYSVSPAFSAYASYGVNGREPARNDILAGFDNLDTSNVKFVGPFNRVRPETVGDLEAGVRYRARAVRVDADVYDMEFRDEIAPIGQLSYLGLPLRKNVPRSVRRGIEATVNWQASKRLSAEVNGAVSHNWIATYTDDASGTTYYDVPPLLTPTVSTNQRLTYAAARGVSLSLEGRYTSRSFLDNTGNPLFVLPAAYITDAQVAWQNAPGHLAITLFVNNLADVRSYSSGYTDGSISYYYPLPPRNLYLQVRAAF
ncbi:MAG TPA: TonB-dependent receptor [Gemmatimonadaceae bacterium]|nr:TonB-dependent receptor [Gemmatimonadaceae bacterium]